MVAVFLGVMSRAVVRRPGLVFPLYPLHGVAVGVFFLGRIWDAIWDGVFCKSSPVAFRALDARIQGGVCGRADRI